MFFRTIFRQKRTNSHVLFPFFALFHSHIIPTYLSFYISRLRVAFHAVMRSSRPSCQRSGPAQALASPSPPFGVCIQKRTSIPTRSATHNTSPATSAHFEPSDSDLDRVIDLNAEWRKLPPFIGTFLLRCGRRKGSRGSWPRENVYGRKIVRIFFLR